MATIKTEKSGYMAEVSLPILPVLQATLDADHAETSPLSPARIVECSSRRACQSELCRLGSYGPRVHHRLRLSVDGIFAALGCRIVENPCVCAYASQRIFAP